MTLRRWPVAVAGLGVAAATMTVLLGYGGGVDDRLLPGLPYPGPFTAWMLPTARLGTQVFAAATVGLLLGATVLAPRRDRLLTPLAYRHVRAARWPALAWAVSSVALLCLTISDLLGRPVGATVSGTSIMTFVSSVDLGRALAVSAMLAVAVFLACTVALRPGGALFALVLALVAVTPAVFTGHAASADNHQLAVSSQLLHVVPVTLWVGGLLALLLVSRTDAGDLARAVSRFSALAVWCLVAVGVSGVLSAAVRLPSWTELLTTWYGQFVLIKVALFAFAGWAGWQHRRATLPHLRAGDRRAFVRVAAVEVLVFAAALGAAVALSRTPAPVAAESEDVATSLLGFAMPPALSIGALATRWLVDPLLLAAVLALAGTYLAGVRRLSRRGDAWPPGRTAAFLAGCAVVAVATCGGIARYAPVLFSVHMVEHLLLAMVAPVLLVLGAPVTLGLRALPATTDPTWPGPREWLLAAVHSRAARLLTQPLVALGVYVVSMYAFYFTDLFALALRSHAAHLLMVAHFLLAGYLFFWVVVGIDPAPRGRPSPLVRMVLVLISMVLHGFLGLAIMQSSDLIAGDWFTALPRDWGPTPADDQYVAGGIAWSFGELPTVLVVGAVFRQWIRADKREQRRLDRAADRAEAGGPPDAHDAYNECLAKVADEERSSHDIDGGN
ncbi:ABC transporter permease [Asanoa siamensis]|uniref:ABC transporter permease n=2 Tax=Asanoa siamensis TaxID=926357 RepID=A0ABQ4D120_9ACTN|nr:ABC transporter permease [Asanoa siamensis]